MTTTWLKAAKGRPVAMVAGGAGFLGSHVCDRLMAEGAHGICIDNLMTRRRPNIAHLRSSPQFSLIEADVAAGLPEIEVKEIWNLACENLRDQFKARCFHGDFLGAVRCVEPLTALSIVGRGENYKAMLADAVRDL